MTLEREDARRAVLRDLEHGENLLWAGRPDPRRAALSGMGCWVLAVPWTAFALFYLYLAVTGGANPLSTSGDWFFVALGLVFTFIGIAMLLTPLWSHMSASKTVYAVTDRRILMVVEGAMRRVTSFLPDGIGALERRERPDGTGDLIVTGRAPAMSEAGSRPAQIRMCGVADVRTAERMISEHLLSGGRTTAITDHGTERL